MAISAGIYEDIPYELLSDHFSSVFNMFGKLLDYRGFKDEEEIPFSTSYTIFNQSVKGYSLIKHSIAFNRVFIRKTFRGLDEIEKLNVYNEMIEYFISINDTCMVYVVLEEYNLSESKNEADIKKLLMLS